jgi:hypothetical protein
VPKSLALLIGVADYKNMQKLVNSGNDARDLSDALSECGFQTTVCTDTEIADLDNGFTDFVDKIDEGDVALFFFAGHGVQIDGANYLMAINTPKNSPLDAKYLSLCLDKVIEGMTAKNGATTIIILDACRNNPWAAHKRGGSSGLAPVYAPKGTLLAFSTSPGETASDGVGGAANGAFTAALLTHIRTADLPIEQMLKRVRNTLSATTGGNQTSWEHTSLSGEFYFSLGVARRITEYGPTALKDGVFVPDPTKWSHKIIEGLKSLNWPKQNKVLSDFTATLATLEHNDDLFVLGRNILQAAQGTAEQAISFIKNFALRTAGMAQSKQKALLDGILFEIFFNSNGDFRFSPKDRNFNYAFNLQKFETLAPSFKFISDALQIFKDRFHVAPPGRRHGVAVNIQLLQDPLNAIDRVNLDGVDVLRLDDKDWEDEERTYSTQSREDFEDLISRQLIIPKMDLTLIYAAGAAPAYVRVPRGYTVAPKR